MNEFEDKIKKFLIDSGAKAEHLVFEKSCHTVEEAAKAVNSTPEDLIKNICMIDDQGNLIVAIVKGEDRASTKRVGKALKIAPPRTAVPEEILKKTGYICGGVPSFGYKACFLIDPKVMEKEFVYSGGGSQNSLIKISTKELQQLNQGQVVRVRR